MKKLAIALGVLLALLVVADFGGAAFAESKLSQQLRDQLHLQEEPPVTIHGFPFLYQVLAGDYRDVEIHADHVPAGQMHDVGVGAHLRHARIPVSDAVAGKTDDLTVDHVDSAVRFRSADVGQLIGIKDLQINPAPEQASAGGKGAPVTLDGTTNIAGNQVHVSVTAELELHSGGKLHLQPRDLKLSDSRFGNIPLGSLFEKSILRQFSTTVDPGPLPFGITPSGVHAEPGALVVDATADHVSAAQMKGH